MVKLLLGLDDVPSPHDVADAIAVAICHVHSSTGAVAGVVAQHAPIAGIRSWRHYQPDDQRPRGTRSACGFKK